MKPRIKAIFREESQLASLNKAILEKHKMPTHHINETYINTEDFSQFLYVVG